MYDVCMIHPRDRRTRVSAIFQKIHGWRTRLSADMGVRVHRSLIHTI